MLDNLVYFNGKTCQVRSMQDCLSISDSVDLTQTQLAYLKYQFIREYEHLLRPEKYGWIRKDPLVNTQS